MGIDARFRKAVSQAARGYRACLRRQRCVGVVLVVVSGIGISGWAAQQTAEGTAQQSRQSFRLAATHVGDSLDLEVQRETDLLNAAAAFMRERPRAYRPAFRRWVANVSALKRYPELVALFAIQPAPATPGGCPLVAFAGLRWTTRLHAVGRSDVCATASSLGLTRDSGRLTGFGFKLSREVRLYGQSLPVYRTTSVPPTIRQRRREFVGWVVIVAYPRVLLQRALSGTPGVRLAVGTTSVDRLTFTAGRRTQGETFRAGLGNGSVASIVGRVQGASILDDSTAILILLGGSTVSGLIGLVLFLLGTSRERALQLVAEKTGELAHQALHDGLTGLANRTLLMDRAAHALARAARTGSSVAVLFIDTDGFKDVNDTLGHDAGDQVLRVIAGRLRGAIRGADTVGRLGGDEFVVLLESEESAACPELVAGRILEALRQTVEVQAGLEVHITASIGIAIGQRESAEELLRYADLALYAAKAAGRNRQVTFADEMETAMADRRSLALDLESAIPNGELFLVYQPTFHLDDVRLRGTEALLRWQHPERGVVSPDQFIPLAEESGLIVEIGRWVAAEACRQAVVWKDRGIELVMAINVSGRQLDEADFAPDIASILETTGLEPASLVLEVTETALMRDPRAAAERLLELKRLGVRIAIDDFGTGYSSLAYLRQFPFDALKIDRSFIAGMGSSSDAAALVKTLVELGKSLHITTLGEGIENELQLEQLRRLGCDLGQGFLLARPLPVEQCDELLDELSTAHEHSAGRIPNGTHQRAGSATLAPESV